MDWIPVVLSGIISIIVALVVWRVQHWLQNRRSHTEAEESIRGVEDLMPKLFKEMRKDLASHPLARRVVVRHSSTIFNGEGFFHYYTDVHDELPDKFRILENKGLVMDESSEHTPRYRLTEELVEYLKKA